MYKILEKYYYDRSMQQKLMIFHTLLITSLVVALTTFVFAYSTRLVVSQQNSHSQKMIYQIKNSLENNISDIERLTAYFESDGAAGLFLMDASLVDEEAMKSLQALMRTYTVEQKEIGGMLLINHDGDIVSNDMVKVSKGNPQTDHWYTEAVAEPDKLIIENRPIERSVKSIYDYYSADNMMSISKAVVTENGGQGVLLIDLKIDYIGDMITYDSEQTDAFYYLADTDFNIIFSPVNVYVNRISKDLFLKDSEVVHEVFIKDQLFQVIHDYSPYLDAYFIGVISLDEMSEVQHRLLISMFMVALILLLISFLTAYGFSGFYTKPLKKMQSLMKRVEGGDLTVRFEPKYNDEVGQLGSGFDEMVHAIDNSLIQIEKEQRDKREAELSAFQMQIKPHFLYNSLDTVHWLAKDYGASEIEEIINGLTSFFRIGLSDGQDIIPLEKEIKHLESYLLVQLVRYRDRFTYEIESDEDLRYCKVMKMVLQPIVENAIYHGIKPMNAPGHIDIVTYVDGDLLVYEVTDDGIGITEEAVSRLNRLFEKGVAREEGSGIGLLNVNARIRLMYGENYGVRIKGLEKGTKVTVTQPCHLEVYDV